MASMTPGGSRPSCLRSVGGLSPTPITRRDIPIRLCRDVLPMHPTYPRPYDILIVDEAHNVASTGSAIYVLDSQRTQAVRVLAPHFEHRLFLTATPHNGYPLSFSSLLEL